MKVDGVDVEISGSQEHEGFDCGGSSRVTNWSFGGLEQAIERFQVPVGLMRLPPDHGFLQRDVNHFHARVLGVHHEGVRVLLQKLSLGDLSAGLAFDFYLGNQGMQISGNRLGLQVGVSLEQGWHALGELVCALFDAAHLAHRQAGVADDLGFGNASAWQMQRDTTDECQRHVDASPVDFFNQSSKRAQVAGKLLDGPGISPLVEAQYLFGIDIRNQGETASSLGARNSLNCTGGRRRLVDRPTGQPDVPLASGQHLVSRSARNASQHLTRLHQYAGFEVLGKAIWQLHRKRMHLKMRFPLNEVQVPVHLGQAVADRMHPSMNRLRKATGWLEHTRRRKCLGLLAKISPRYEPRINSCQHSSKYQGSHQFTIPH